MFKNNEQAGSCLSKRTGKPLSRYWCEGTAELAAEDVKRRHGLQLAPYRCNDCHEWHLAPPKTHDNSWLSESCVDRNGTAKRAYPTERDAMKRASCVEDARGLSVYPYHCQTCGRWHLTKGH